MAPISLPDQPKNFNLMQWFSSRSRIWRKNPSFFWGMVIVGIIFLIAIFHKQISPFNPGENNLKNILQAPGGPHLLGTDQYGRDVFSRIISATPLDLEIGILSVLFPLLIGIVVGLFSGFYGGVIDAIFMRLVDIVVAFPFMVLIIALIAVLGPGLKNVIIAVTISSWIIYARIVRSEILIAKKLEYVISARVLGFSDMRIMLRHILPNVVSTAILFGALDISLDILLAATLGFLGLGVQPPTPEWGTIIAEGRNFMTTAWWISFFPGIAIIITGGGFALLADGLADVLRAGGQEA